MVSSSSQVKARGMRLTWRSDESNGLVAPKLIYVSDLAGEHQLDYSYENGRGTIFNLQHYQVLADEATPRL